MEGVAVIAQSNVKIRELEEAYNAVRTAITYHNDAALVAALERMRTVYVAVWGRSGLEVFRRDIEKFLPLPTEKDVVAFSDETSLSFDYTHVPCMVPSLEKARKWITENLGTSSV
ncbi:MAG: hypothetical protein Q7S47_02965 [bacterium]|nr:hypothetical protein [bacterium]